MSKALMKATDKLPEKQSGALAVTEKPTNEGWSTQGMTPQQQVEAEAAKARINTRPKRPEVMVERTDGGVRIIIGNPAEKGDDVLNSIRLYDAFGSASAQFTGSMLARLGRATGLTGNEEVDSEKVAGAVAMIAAVAPQNELEATMALQMVAANEAALNCFERAGRAEFLEHATAFSNMANKAMRSFALHAEAIAKLRRGGEQVVKHVHVSEGGQAVIARTINTGRG